jgi:hypothetical protein
LTAKTHLMLAQVVLICASCSLKDIRPASVRDGISVDERAQGQALLADVEAAYGGRDAWLAKDTGHFTMSADWLGFPNTVISQWETNPQRFEMQVVLGSDDVNLTLVDGPLSGQTYGLLGGRSYRVGPDGVADFDAKVPLAWKMSAKNYWFQLPFRVSEASVVAHAGEAEVDGQRYELVFLSWESAEPQREIDQFVLYVHPEHHHIEWLHITAREKGGWASATVRFEDVVAYGGISVPRTQTAWLGSPEERGRRMHQNTFESVVFGAPITDVTLAESPFLATPQAD